MAFCHQCGTQLVEKAVFCVKCGTRLVETSQALAATPMAPVASRGTPLPAPPPADPLVLGPGTKVGAYKIVSLIGKGGQGATYKAEQVALGRPVCIKVLHAHLAKDPHFSARFELEGRATAAIRHPNVVSVFDVGALPDGTAYIVMEMVDGQQLRQLKKALGALEPLRAAALVDQVLAGLGEAHANNIIHRDLKPSNVLVAKLRDGSELVKVVDFGIALMGGQQVPGDPAPGSGEVLGTPGYMAPEQLKGLKEDARADLYAVGVILWELVSGQRLFAPASGAALHAQHLRTPAPALASVGKPAPAWLEAALQRALAKDPAQRFADADAFRAALRVGLSAAPSPAAATTPAAAPRAEARLAGRERELAKLGELLTYVAGKRPAGAVLTGRRGMGKTRLLFELERQAAAKGFLVAHVSGRASAERMSAVRELTAAVARQLGAEAATEGGGSDSSRALKVLLRAAELRPTLLVVDDADQADPQSLEFLDELLARATERSLGVLLSARAKGTPVLQRLPRLALTELDAAALAALVRGLLPAGEPGAELLELLGRSASGNPWLVSLLTGSLLESGHVAERAGSWVVTGTAEAVTDAVQLTVGVELEKLPAQAQQVLLVSALQGRRFMVDLAQRIADDGVDVSALLRLCAAQGWVSRVDDARYEFEEPLTQLALRAMSSLAQLKLVVSGITDLLAFEVPANVELLQGIARALFTAAAQAPRSERPAFFDQLTSFFDALGSHGRFTQALEQFEALLAYLKTDRALLEAGGEAAQQLRAHLTSPAFVDPLVSGLSDPRHGADAEAALRRVGRSALPQLLAQVPDVASAEARGRLVALLLELSPDAKTAQAVGKHLDAKTATELARRVRSQDATKAAPIFALLLSAVDPALRRTAAHLVPMAAVPLLGKNLIAARLGDPDVQTRLAFLMRVTEAEEPLAKEPILGLLQRQELELAQRVACYGALTAIDKEAALDVLRRDVDTHPSPDVRVAAVQATGRLGTPLARAMLDELSRKLLQSPKVRAAAKDALTMLEQRGKPGA